MARVDLARQGLPTRLPARCHRLFGLGLAGLTKLAARLSDDSGAGHVARGRVLHDRLVGVAGHEGVRRFVAGVLAGNAVAGRAFAVRSRNGEPR
ncbi:Uncharacterised protein [Amycolatopsis camponoti]|uniref:Uncharacterized protein n=1 Tax=Amycolatopsis camponoti TaxID=2606593 RepID=A0A6I8M2F8_9PSEU|nr:hypothetical protein [Amycolatopsis camponoti]VVJ21780.1 Uncharacterised protein [Amycolatopsis camponoti]